MQPPATAPNMPTPFFTPLPRLHLPPGHLRGPAHPPEEYRATGRLSRASRKPSPFPPTPAPLGPSPGSGAQAPPPPLRPQLPSRRAFYFLHSGRGHHPVLLKAPDHVLLAACLGEPAKQTLPPVGVTVGNGDAAEELNVQGQHPVRASHRRGTGHLPPVRPMVAGRNVPAPHSGIGTPMSVNRNATTTVRERKSPDITRPIRHPPDQWALCTSRSPALNASMSFSICFFR